MSCRAGETPQTPGFSPWQAHSPASLIRSDPGGEFHTLHIGPIADRSLGGSGLLNFEAGNGDTLAWYSAFGGFSEV